MCRLLGYLGPPRQLDTLLTKPDHSLVVQSYQPREMTAGLLNADGFGVGWYHPTQATEPFVYRNTQPIWSDPNLDHLARYVESGCILANVRSATVGQAVQLSNCQPFRFGHLLGVHNGFIENFRQTLKRPIRDRLHPSCDQAIEGTTDSEHIFALLCSILLEFPDLPLDQGVTKTLHILAELAASWQVRAGINLIISDGQQLVACRFAYPQGAPSLYWLRGDAPTEGIVIASEPLFASDRWLSCPENSVLAIGADFDIQTYTV
jgi:ergothioneine biosynthesis protein EgtC